MTSKYFDATPKTSAAGLANALGIPFIALDRPGYEQTTPLPSKPPEKSSFFQEEGKWLHEHVLPTIWQQYASVTGATCLVLLGHSMGCPSVIVAAALSALTKSEDYVLGGIICSGWGTAHGASPEQTRALLEGKSWDHRFTAHAPPEVFRFLLYGSEDQDLAESDVRNHEILGTTGFSYGEMHDGGLQWLGYWVEKYASKVQVPLLYGMGAVDGLWQVNEHVVQEFAEAFTESKHVESRMFEGAPHCMEVSRWSRVWLLRCFAFAAEVAIRGGK